MIKMIDFIYREKKKSISGFKLYFLPLLNDKLLSIIALKSMFPADSLADIMTIAASLTVEHRKKFQVAVRFQ